jgi:flagellar hook-basal body complex protein FliE
MTDPLGLIGPIDRSLPPLLPPPGQAQGHGGPGFTQLLNEQIEKVNQLQQDANAAIEDLATGGRDDLESVLIATQKADMAFKLLLQVRNKVMDAFEEVKQMRV